MIVRQYVPSANPSNEAWYMQRKMIVKNKRKQNLYRMLAKRSDTFVWCRTEVEE